MNSWNNCAQNYKSILLRAEDEDGSRIFKACTRLYGRKDFFEQGNYMDAYHHVVESLHHLARLAVIENGLFPEVTVWSQVKRLTPRFINYMKS